MKKGDFLFLVVIIAFVIFALVCYTNDDQEIKKRQPPPSGLPVPMWTRENFQFQRDETIDLSFDYDYTNSIYNPSQIRFYVGIWDCGDSSCPIPQGRPPFSGQGKPIQYINFLGNDTNYGYNPGSGSSQEYDISQSPPGGSWNTGTYIAFIIAALDQNRKVVSDPSEPALIDINYPGDPPPTPIITEPTNLHYYSNEDANNIFISWKVDSGDYGESFSYNVLITDKVTGEPVTDPINTFDTSTTVSLYPGEFMVIVQSVADCQGGPCTSSSNSVTFFVRLPSVTNVQVTSSS